MISYIGGKSRIGKWIEPFIPNDIELYAEPFGGMFWVFFNMDLMKYPNLKTVVYNDFNKLNANLIKCSKDYDKLWNELKKYPCQEIGIEHTPQEYKDLFKKFQKEIFDENYIIGNDPNFDAAVKYTYVLTQIFSGAKPETAKYTDYKGKYKCKYLVFMDKLKNDNFRKHFDKITFVESLDFQELMEKYDGKNSYFYLDPPYFKTENYYSNHDFGKDDHERLANVLNNIEGKFSLSYYDFTLLNDWYPKDKFIWEEKEFSKAAAASKGKAQNKSTELLIMNYGNR